MPNDPFTSDDEPVIVMTLEVRMIPDEREFLMGVHRSGISKEALELVERAKGNPLMVSLAAVEHILSDATEFLHELIEMAARAGRREGRE
ncbi:MAG: hypothetical protein V3U30_02910 [Thermoplasmata archaeon]